MKPRHAAPLILCALLLLTACPSKKGSGGALAPLRSPAPGETGRPSGVKATPRASAATSAAPRVTAPVRRPKPGQYVYDLVGRNGTTVPSGSQIVQNISISGDVVTADISNNKNANTRRIQYRWLGDKVEQLSVETTKSGSTTKCTFEPPFTLHHIPIYAERIPTQSWSSKECSGQINIEVVGREDVTDATGRMWVAWSIETAGEKRWFSTELGVDIRNETDSVVNGATQHTATVLRSYPK